MSLITYLTRIHFADRVLEDALSEELVRLGVRRPLVISDPHDPDLDGLDRLFDALPVSARPAHFVTGGKGASGTERTSANGLFERSHCDGIIGFGTRRPLDLARLIGHPGRKVITIPTATETIGLGPIGIDRGPRAQRGDIPDSVLCDPTLTIAASPIDTAVAGLGALVHCLESFLSTAFNPPADGMALEGLRRAWTHLEAAVTDGHDLAARRELLAAALNAGLAAEKGFGGIEAAAYGLEATTNTRYGVLHGALLAEVMTFNAPAVADRIAAIRRTLGLSDGSDFIAELVMLVERIGLPVRLSAAGIDAPLLPKAALRAAADPANRTNPRHATAQDYEVILRAVL